MLVYGRTRKQWKLLYKRMDGFHTMVERQIDRAWPKSVQLITRRREPVPARASTHRRSGDFMSSSIVVLQGSLVCMVTRHPFIGDAPNYDQFERYSFFFTFPRGSNLSPDGVLTYMPGTIYELNIPRVRELGYQDLDQGIHAFDPSYRYGFLNFDHRYMWDHEDSIRTGYPAGMVHFPLQPGMVETMRRIVLAYTHNITS